MTYPVALASCATHFPAQRASFVQDHEVSVAVRHVDHQILPLRHFQPFLGFRGIYLAPHPVPSLYGLPDTRLEARFCVNALSTRDLF